MNPSFLDVQMRQHATRLKQDVGLDSDQACSFATSICKDFRPLVTLARERFAEASAIPLPARYEEVLGFQLFSDFCNSLRKVPPGVVRARVLAQNYVCFVYLPEFLFREARKLSRPGTTLHKSTEYLTNNRLRAFRNAVAHANWQYRDDFTGLIFYARARKGAGTDPSPTCGKPTAEEPMQRFEVTDEELGFWQALARCTGYVLLEELRHAK
jgi:hypothetical protein